MHAVDVNPENEYVRELSASEIHKLEPHINYSDIALQLLGDRMLLTALELHCELIESGKEVPRLKEFFSNPGNFEPISRPEIPSGGLARWSSQATLDSLDMTRFSEDGEKATDDRIAVLEFELRKAKETINALRTNLTVAYECEPINQDYNSSSVVSSVEPIKPHEQRALNFLINEYLLMHGYKLTSNTFADENENQDFEVWDDVGLNIPKPPELLHLYREFMRSCHIPCTDCQTEHMQMRKDTEEIELLISQLNHLKEHVSELEMRNKELADSCVILRENNLGGAVAETVPLETMNFHYAAPTSESGSIHDQFIVVDSYPLSNSDHADIVEDISSLEISDHLPTFGKSKSFEIIGHTESTESTYDSIDWLRLSEHGSMTKIEYNDNILRLLNENSIREIPVAFQNEIIARCYIGSGSIPDIHLLTEEIAENDAFNRFMHITIGSLYKIASCIPDNNKEDLILLIVYIIKHHPSATVREKLIQLLFRLKRKPKDEERKALLSGIVWLARTSDSSILENELLPHCWEELNHKYAENRLLVSELCCCLTPYVSAVIRNSSLISLLQQILLDDKEDRVRVSAIHSIAFIAAFIGDDDKYVQCEELLFTGLLDTSDSVIEATSQVLLPVLSKWAFDIDKLTSHLIPRLLHILDAQIKAAVHQYKNDFGSPFKRSPIWQDRCSWTIGVLRRILPYVVMHVASAPFVLQFVHPNLPNASSRSSFSEVCKDLCNPRMFYEGKYSLGQIIRAFDTIVAEQTWPQLDWLCKTLIPELLDITSQVDTLWEGVTIDVVTLFRLMCAGFGETTINNKMKSIFAERLENIEKELADVTAKCPNLFVLPIFILAVLVPQQETEEIQSTLRRFLFTLPLCSCPITAFEYCVKELSKINFTHDLLIAVLWEGVVHAREAVRLIVVQLFSSIIPYSTDLAIVNRIIPAIVTLSDDTNSLIKTAAVPVLGQLIKNVSTKEVSDKCCFQIQTLLSEKDLWENHVYSLQLISTLGEIASHVDPAFREDVLIPHLAACTVHSSQLNNQSRKQELFRALFDAFSAAIYCSFSKNTIPDTLISGLRCLESICGDSIAHREAVESLIKEVESKTRGADSATDPLTSTVNVNVGLEVKQRMTKIFQIPISKQSKFWRK